MKKILALAVAAGALAAAVVARGAETETLPYRPVLRAELTRFEADPSLLQGQEILGGDVTVDLRHREIQLTLFARNHCPPGALCAMEMPAPFIRRLPIVRVGKECGSTIYFARRDQRPVDGALQELKVADHSTRLCHDLRAATEVTYDVETPRFDRPEHRSSSSFEGERLMPVPATSAPDLQ